MSFNKAFIRFSVFLSCPCHGQIFFKRLFRECDVSIPRDILLHGTGYPAIAFRRTAARAVLQEITRIPINCGLASLFDQEPLRPAAADLISVPSGIGVRIVSIGTRHRMTPASLIFCCKFIEGREPLFEGHIPHSHAPCLFRALSMVYWGQRTACISSRHRARNSW